MQPSRLLTADTICNGCRRRRPTSKEHLIHLAVGRALMRDRTMDRATMQARLADDYWGGFKQYDQGLVDETSRPAPLGWWVRDLICRDCNGGWAKRLEERAGAHLYEFLHVYAEADATLLGRWAWFFAFKARFYYRRTEVLRSGPLADVLPHLAGARLSQLPPVWLSRLDASPRRWRFALHYDWAFVTNTVVWVAQSKRNMRPPFAARALEDGLRVIDLPRVRVRELGKLWLS